MKKSIAIFLVLIAAGGLAFGQMSTLSAKDARSMGMGGTFSAFSSGYSSFFGNPAGFAGKGSFTVIDDASWLYVKPTEDNLAKIQSIANGASSSEIRATLNDFITTNGFGGGSSSGFGWAGGGFALGAFVISDQYVSGTTLLGSKLVSSNSANAVLGLGIPIINAKNLKLQLGGDVRPFFRVDSLGSGWNFNDILTPLIGDGGDVMTALRSQNISSGYGLAMDFGGQLTVGPLMFGVSVRDIAPTFKTGTSTVGELMDGTLPSFTINSTLKPQVTAGAGLSLKIIPKIIETNIYAEMKDLISVVQDGKDPFTQLHAGADLKLLSFVTLRGGVSSGYYSVGAGIDLILLELDAAVFTEELGIKAGDNPRSGVSIQAAFRF